MSMQSETWHVPSPHLECGRPGGHSPLHPELGRIGVTSRDGGGPLCIMYSHHLANESIASLPRRLKVRYLVGLVLFCRKHNVHVKRTQADPFGFL
jgi:hypothetical protein